MLRFRWEVSRTLTRTTLAPSMECGFFRICNVTASSETETKGPWSVSMLLPTTSIFCPAWSRLRLSQLPCENWAKEKGNQMGKGGEEDQFHE